MKLFAMSFETGWIQSVTCMKGQRYIVSRIIFTLCVDVSLVQLALFTYLFIYLFICLLQIHSIKLQTDNYVIDYLISTATEKPPDL